MGCGGSKSLGTVAVEDAIQEIKEEGQLEEGKAQEMAKLTDRNADGQIERKILVKVKKDFADTLKLVHAQQCDNGTISQDDAFKVLKKRFHALPSERLHDMVHHFNKDDNGMISAQDVAFHMVRCINLNLIAGRKWKELERDREKKGEVLSREAQSQLIMKQFHEVSQELHLMGPTEA